MCLKNKKWKTYISILKLIFDNQKVLRKVNFNLDNNKVSNSFISERFSKFKGNIFNLAGRKTEIALKVLKLFKLINVKSQIYYYDNVKVEIIEYSSLQVTLKGILFLYATSNKRLFEIVE
jgi:hypothetical protein